MSPELPSARKIKAQTVAPRLTLAQEKSSNIMQTEKPLDINTLGRWRRHQVFVLALPHNPTDYINFLPDACSFQSLLEESTKPTPTVRVLTIDFAAHTILVVCSCVGILLLVINIFQWVLPQFELLSGSLHLVTRTLTQFFFFKTPVLSLLLQNASLQATHHGTALLTTR